MQLMVTYTTPDGYTSPRGTFIRAIGAADFEKTLFRLYPRFPLDNIPFLVLQALEDARSVLHEEP